MGIDFLGQRWGMMHSAGSVCWGHDTLSMLCLVLWLLLKDSNFTCERVQT